MVRGALLLSSSLMWYSRRSTRIKLLSLHRKYNRHIRKKKQNNRWQSMSIYKCSITANMYFYLLVMPIPRINELIAVDDTPRRRSPASVNKRGSSHPSTHFSVTSRFNCSRTWQQVEMNNDMKLLILLSPFQIIRRFGFSRYIDFTTYLDIVYI